MKYQVVLYNLANGMKQLAGVVVDEKPSVAWMQIAKVLYGAERYQLVEIESEVNP